MGLRTRNAKEHTKNQNCGLPNRSYEMMNLIDVGSTELKIAFLSTGDSIVFKTRKVLMKAPPKIGLFKIRQTT